jgi:polar amino acid transport system substrate-binding protein
MSFAKRVDMMKAIFLIFICVFLMAFVAQADSCTKTIRTTEEPPYHYSSTEVNGGVTGTHADTIRAVLEMMNCNAVFVNLPWARAMADLQSGRIDIISGVFDTPERRQFAHYAQSGYVSPNVLFMREKDPRRAKISSFSDFMQSDLVLGALIDVNYGPEYWQAKQSGLMNERLSLTSDRRLLWRLLSRDRVDAVISDRLTALVEMKRFGFANDIVNTGIALSSDPAYIIFSKASVDEAFVTRFNEVYTALSESGVLQQITELHTQAVLNNTEEMPLP